MKLRENEIVVLENGTKEIPEDFIKLAKRDQNNRRKFLLVNSRQGKHLPAVPADALALFAQLGRMLTASYTGKRVVVIGFAETATAIGAAVASAFGAETPYLHTTREAMAGMTNLADFQEEHSHATQQRLFCAQPDLWLRQAEVVIFVEDEISTGKTILNFIAALKANGWLRPEQQLVAASLLNGMHSAHMEVYQEKGIVLHYLLKLQCALDLDPYPDLTGDEDIELSEQLKDQALHPLSGRLDSRGGVLIGAYDSACCQLAEDIMTLLEQQLPQGAVLVLGTEELMYPAIRIGQIIAERWPQYEVRTHATTRSPIKASMKEEDYPIKRRYRLESVYERDRQTFVYNLAAYDTAIILLDSPQLNEKGYRQLCGALQQAGCRQILGIRWTEA